MDKTLSIYNVEEKIIDIRKRKVILDNDVAELYEVETKRINEAVRNNPNKFPKGYVIELSLTEWKDLKSKFSTSSWGGKNKVPKAFTEKGLYMLATILKSDKSIKTTLAIIETFTKIRELSRNITEISNVKDKGKQKTLLQRSGDIIGELIDDDLKIEVTETTIELNLAVMKIKHTIKRK